MIFSATCYLDLHSAITFHYLTRKLQPSQEVTIGILTHLIVLASNVGDYNAPALLWTMLACCCLNHLKLMNLAAFDSRKFTAAAGLS